MMRGCLLLLLVVPALLTGCPSKSTEPAEEFAFGSHRPTSLSRPKRLTRKERLVKLLTMKELPTEKQLRALGSGVDSDLADIINNRQAIQGLRLRALYCMGYFQNRRSRLLLRAVLTDPNWDKPYRIAALEASARAIGVEAYEMVKEHALDPDKEMRLAAVRALVSIGTPDVLGLLRSLQLREKDPDVLHAIDEALRQVGRSPLEGR